MTNFLRSMLSVVLFSLLAISAFAQGTTTSLMQGKISDAAGEFLIGANIVALHQPTGTTYGAVSDLDGNYRIPNMRVGGPYKVTITYTGYADIVLDGVYLRLGEAFKSDFTMQEASFDLGIVEIVARTGTTGTNTGTSTQITSEAIENIPTLNRDLSDYVRLTPQASGYGGGTTFAGVNNRYNAIYIDGAVNNDVFGLSSSGTNGGQTGIAPFSIDIIDQFQVVLSPYDVTLGGFAGGGINAVTKSGTNKLQGTAYLFWQNEGFVGKTNTALTDRTGSEPTQVADFTQRTFGFSLGGPIVKDKVFFFANAEFRNDETPAPFDFGTYLGDASEDDLEALRTFVNDEYGYDPGTFGGITDNLDGVSLFGKLDININANHRLTLRHSYTKAEQTNRNASSANRIRFSNDGIYFPSVTNSSALELKSTFGTKYSNNLIIGFTTVRDDRDPIGGDFPYVFINDGSGQISFGSEEFSTGNALNQDVFTITDNFKLYLNNHTVTVGTHNEFYSTYNLFIPQNYGTYRFASIADFIAGANAIEYDRAYSLVDDLTGDGSKAAADFNAMQLGFYVQDEWAVSPRLSVTGGVRLDLPIIMTDPAIDANFNTTVLPQIQDAYADAGNAYEGIADVRDAVNNVEGGAAPQGQLMISPRLGAEYALKADRSLMLRGGVGVFTSRIPFVWPGAMFNNNGLTQGRVDETNAGGPIAFISDIQQQYTNANFTVPSGQVDLFVKDFKYPQVLRGNLALDASLPYGIKGTVEGIYTKTLNNIVYYNVNSSPTVSFNWTNFGTDDRPVFTRSRINSTYSDIYVADNTNEGYTYTLTASLAKQFDFGLNTSLSYTWGDATAVNEGTSSQNSSQWRGQVNTEGRNSPLLGRSDFALGHRVLAVATYEFKLFQGNDAKTAITLFYEGQTGSPYSYVIGGSNARNMNNELGSTSANRSLAYIPNNASEITLVERNGLTPAEQWELLDAFIESDPYLSANRGGYAEKNSNFMPYTSFLDLSFRQDLGVFYGGKLQVSWDVFNLANLLNNEWGVRYSVPGDFNNYFLYNFEGYAADGTTPRFSYTREGTGKDALIINDFSSRWRMRLGVRYIF